MQKNAVKSFLIHNMAPNINEAILLNIDVQYFALPLSVSPASFLHFHSASFLPICKNKMHNTLDFVTFVIPKAQIKTYRAPQLVL